MKSGIQGCMIPYFKSAIQSGFGVIVMNPNSNSAMVHGHKVRILNSASPEDHVMYVWETFILPYSCERINFVAYDLGGPLIKYLLKVGGEILDFDFMLV